MATRKSTTKQTESRRRAKLAKVEAKQSKLVAPPQQAAKAPHSPLGGELLLQLKKAVGTSLLLEEHKSTRRAERAACAANRLAETLALVPPSSAVEALAAAILIGDDLETFRNCADGFIKTSAADRIEQRVAGLAAWIETTHQVDRHDWHLDYFGADNDLAMFIPHAEMALNVLPEHDR
jgi:hypothetical protein